VIGRSLAAIVSAAALLTGCTGGDADSVKAKGTLVVGATLELTGSGAPGGTAAGNALKIAADQVNTAGVKVGGRTLAIRVVVRDNRSDLVPPPSRPGNSSTTSTQPS
jgi:ABC-type branched-subunit amino acid transport system substrate-binding protein